MQNDDVLLSVLVVLMVIVGADEIVEVVVNEVIIWVDIQYELDDEVLDETVECQMGLVINVIDEIDELEYVDIDDEVDDEGVVVVEYE